MYRWVEHTSEVELEVQAPSTAGVFADALAAFRELLGEPPASGQGPERRSFELHGGDHAVLLAEWLEELVFLAETEGFVPAAVEEIELEADGLRTVVSGSLGRPPHVVKAVTYHRLEFEPAGVHGYRARVVLDV